jgi:hypothetical protein
MTASRKTLSAADVFGAGSDRGGPAQPTIDVKSLHAKIGELTLENDPKCPSGDFLIPWNHFDSMDAFLILDSKGPPVWTDKNRAVAQSFSAIDVRFVMQNDVQQ